jgi:molybdopterin converting factor subunit 1
MDDQETMKIKVKFFALARDLAGTGETSLDLPASSTTEAAVSQIVAAYPNLASIRPRLAIALNQSYVRENQSLREGDEIALIPPVSGG